MKTFRIMCAALVAAMTLASCQKEQAGKDNGPQQPKTITISLSNVQTPVKSFNAPVQDGTTATVNNFQVFFANAAGDEFYKGLAADGTEMDHYITVNTSADLTQTFHFVDPNVEQVLVVANLSDSEATYADVATLKAQVIEIASQQDVDDLVLFGYDDSLEASSEDHESAHHPSNVYTAAVEIAPLVARIEIVNFKTIFPVNSAFKSVTVNQIAFNDYYTKADLTGAVSSVPADHVDEDIEAATVYNYLDGLTGTPWSDDKLEATMTPAANTATFADGKVYAYNFFPVAATLGTEAGYPQLVIGAESKDVQDKTVRQFLSTKSFSNVASGFEPGKVYKVAFTFEATKLENQLKCVEMTVTVKEWTVVNVTPNV